MPSAGSKLIEFGDICLSSANGTAAPWTDSHETGISGRLHGSIVDPKTKKSSTGSGFAWTAFKIKSSEMTRNSDLNILRIQMGRVVEKNSKFDCWELTEGNAGMTAFIDGKTC